MKNFFSKKTSDFLKRGIENLHAVWLTDLLILTACQHEWGMLSYEVRELRSLYVHIYIFVLLFLVFGTPRSYRMWKILKQIFLTKDETVTGTTTLG